MKPYAYACPANCGCLWRDNEDDTMSLFGRRSQSCEVCEPLPLNKLVPLYATRHDAQRAIRAAPPVEPPQEPET